MEKMICYKGIKFYPDGNKKYYYNSKIRRELHQYIYECEVGPIPKGYHVHHKDLNKENNAIDNLVCLQPSEHEKLHASLFTEERKNKMRKTLNEKARPKAIEWHKSEEGRKWHSKHAKEISLTMKKKEYVCKYCGIKFFKKPLGPNKFCSNKCKSAWRRKAGLDNETRICVICGKEFSINKYSKAKTCSPTCGSKLAYMSRKITISD